MSALEDDVLPQLRKATIIIRSYQPKRTDEEIATLSTTTPEELDVKELLFSATLTSDEITQNKLYTTKQLNYIMIGEVTIILLVCI